jgi:uncharacterized protein (TIGR02145 family)
MLRNRIIGQLLFFKLYLGFIVLFTSSAINAGVINNNISINNREISTEINADSIRCGDNLQDLLKQFVRFDHTDGIFNYYSVKLSVFNSTSERGYFYEAAKSDRIFMADKSEFDEDSALFLTGDTMKLNILNHIYNLYKQTIDGRKYAIAQSALANPISSPLGVPTCDGALVACSSNTYSFPAGTQGSAPPPVNGYPNYGCLNSYPCPAYFYMQIGVAGNIVIQIQQSGGHDVDFICWGPFSSLTDGCDTGLTGTCNISGQPICCNNNSPGCTTFYPRGNITDCSYSSSSTETCHILDAQVGQIYILLITNFSQQPGTITFQQTGGSGVTNCDIVIFCSMIAVTATPSACDSLTNTFSISGDMEFSNPPPTGTLTITDNTAVPPVSETFPPPFVSPLQYNLTGIPCDGIIHTLTASFSDSSSCTLSQQVTSPPQTCPQAQISGGGEICSDGTSTVPVDISFSGVGPYNFTYAINGNSEPPVNNYNGSSPYILNTNIPGTYTLVSVSNQVCLGTGPVSGSATVTLNPLPIPTLTGTGVLCAGSAGVVYSTDPGKSDYRWIVSTGGTISSGGTTVDNSVTVTWNTPGVNSVSVNYNDPKGCTADSSTILPVTVNPLPTPIITGSSTVCQGITGVIYTTQAGMTNYLWNISAGGTVLSGGSVTDNSVTISWIITGSQTVSVNYHDVNGCTAASSTLLPVTVNTLPTPAITGSNAVCQGITGVIYTTQAGMTNYQWNISAGGTITSGGSVTDNSVTVSWIVAGPQSVSVNYHDLNGCTAASSTLFPVTVNSLPTPTIIGSNAICQGITGVIYTTQTGMTNYIWNISAGGTVTSGGSVTDNSVTVSWVVAGPQSVSVNYQNVNGCTASSPASYPVTVNPIPAASGSITGSVGPCQGSKGVPYSVGSIANATSYSWTLNPGSAGTINGNTASVAVDWSSNFTGSGTLMVEGVNNCGNGVSSPVLSILVNPKPLVSYNMCTDSITTPDAGIIYLREGIPLGGTYSGTAVNSATGTFNPATAGLGTHSITYSYTNVNSCTNSALCNITVTDPGLFVCGGNLKDVRDNKFYPTIQIGSHCWMSVNLDYGSAILSTLNQTDNCIPEKYCFGNNPSNCGIDGGLYQWDELMAYSVVQGSHGICPPGWHVPAESEWIQLFNNYIDKGFAGSALKATGYSGFNALISGVNFLNRIYTFNSFAGIYWSSDSDGPYKAWAHGMNSFNPSVSFYPGSRSNSFSVRCLKD